MRVFECERRVVSLSDSSLRKQALLFVLSAAVGRLYLNIVSGETKKGGARPQNIHNIRNDAAHSLGFR